MEPPPSLPPSLLSPPRSVSLVQVMAKKHNKAHVTEEQPASTCTSSRYRYRDVFSKTMFRQCTCSLAPFFYTFFLKFVCLYITSLFISHLFWHEVLVCLNSDDLCHADSDADSDADADADADAPKGLQSADTWLASCAGVPR